MNYAIALCCLLATLFPALGRAQAPKAYFTVISETGVPHSAVLLEYPDGKQQWLGFKPKHPKHPVDDGKIDESDSTKIVKIYVRFEVDAKALEDAEKAVRKEFEGTAYRVGVHDCVNLSVSFAEHLKIRVPPKPNIFPDHFVENLAKLNQVLKPISGNNKAPFPWVK